MSKITGLLSITKMTLLYIEYTFLVIINFIFENVRWVFVGLFSVSSYIGLEELLSDAIFGLSLSHC